MAVKTQETFKEDSCDCVGCKGHSHGLPDRGRERRELEGDGQVRSKVQGQHKKEYGEQGCGSRESRVLTKCLHEWWSGIVGEEGGHSRSQLDEEEDRIGG